MEKTRIFGINTLHFIIADWFATYQGKWNIVVIISVKNTVYILLLTNRVLKFMFSVISVYLSSVPMQDPNSAFPEHKGTDI